MDADYTPFPEKQLDELAGHCYLEGIYYRDRGDNLESSRYFNRAGDCRAALLSFAALRERCLLAETENAQLKRQLAIRPLESAGPQDCTGRRNASSLDGMAHARCIAAE